MEIEFHFMFITQIEGKYSNTIKAKLKRLAKPFAGSIL